MATPVPARWAINRPKPAAGNGVLLPPLLLLLLLVLVGCGGELVGQADPTPPPTPSAAPTAPTRPVSTLAVETDRPPSGSGSTASAPAAGSADAAPLDAVAIVQRVAPAVVTVVNEQQAAGFGRAQSQEAGRGTGFIVDARGNIVTNEHVVRGGDRFEVIFADGEKRPAELIGADRRSDLAVVRVEGGLPATVPFGDSDALLVGQPVLAIGSPLGEFSNTVTDGIVSALGRDLGSGDGQGEAAYSNLIQHNAAINPGNSGGPLFDFDGRVVGVNTLGLPRAQGLFFAIPANIVAEIAGQLIETGRVAYPFLGIERFEINPQIASQNDLPVEYGAYVMGVDADTPAARAGIQPGDIVVAIGDRRIDQRTSFSEALFDFRPGDVAPIAVVRGGDELRLEVTLGERAPDV